MESKDRLTVRYHGQTVGTLSLTPDNKLCAFEYDAGWLAEGFSISPLELPLRSGLFIAKPQPLYGNFGIFEDSMPDGYGRYLLHKTLMQSGIDDSSLSSLDRLSIIGDNGMGALTYAPATKIEPGNSTCNLEELQEKAIEVLKEQQDSDAGLLLYNSGNSGGRRPKAVFTDSDGHWLVKFRHIYDPLDMGVQEFHHNEIARKCGINVPDFKLMNGKYFTTRRFDIAENGERVHVATCGGLLCLSLSNPVLDYNNLLALTGFLTQNGKDVEEMYRRMVFNYLTGNKDDHCKNFSFMTTKSKDGKWEWRLAPAYDLTLCTAGYNGEHATSVNGTGHPTLEDFIAVGSKTRMDRKRCMEIFEKVFETCGDILHPDCIVPHY